METGNVHSFFLFDMFGAFAAKNGLIISWFSFLFFNFGFYTILDVMTLVYKL